MDEPTVVNTSEEAAHEEPEGGEDSTLQVRMEEDWNVTPINLEDECSIFLDNEEVSIGDILFH